jgi:competence protein ComEC
VSFLDVGQGDATLIQHPDGTAILFDGGPPEARVVRLLRDAGVRRLDVVVATHASRDHHGGLAEVVEELPVGTFVDGGDGSGDAAFQALVRAVAGNDARVIGARTGTTVRAGAVTVRILSPPPRPPGPAPEDPNPRAVVAVVSSGGFDLLLSGDAESDALGTLPLPDVDAMKVPHHGSSDPGLPAVLERARPEVAAIPVGENPYGHPAPSTLQVLAERVQHVRRTDEHGTIRLRVDAGAMTIETER